MTRGSKGRKPMDLRKPIILSVSKRLTRAKYRENRVVAAVLNMKIKTKDDMRLATSLVGAMCDSSRIFSFYQQCVLRLLSEQNFFVSGNLQGRLYKSQQIYILSLISAFWNSDACKRKYEALTVKLFKIFPIFDRLVILFFYLSPYSTASDSLVQIIYDACGQHFAECEIERQLRMINITDQDQLSRLMHLLLDMASQLTLPDFWLKLYGACKENFNEQVSDSKTRVINALSNIIFDLKDHNSDLFEENKSLKSALTKNEKLFTQYSARKGDQLEKMQNQNKVLTEENERLKSCLSKYVEYF